MRYLMLALPWLLLVQPGAAQRSVPDIAQILENDSTIVCDTIGRIPLIKAYDGPVVAESTPHYPDHQQKACGENTIARVSCGIPEEEGLKCTFTLQILDGSVYLEDDQFWLLAENGDVARGQIVNRWPDYRHREGRLLSARDLYGHAQKLLQRIVE